MRLCFALLTVILCALVPAALAQSAAATGTIAGVVTDASGAAIPGATVTIKNTDSSSTRTLASDASGAFAATFLPAGAYTIEVKASGFQPRKPARVTVGAGTSVRVEARMSLPQLKQEVTVTGTAPTLEGQTTAPTINKQEPVVANSVAGLTVTYLPNRNRDFSQFAQLAAGAQPDADENGLVVAGQRPENSKMAIDGADFNDPLDGGQRGARDGALFFPQTVVREFQIVHAGATAEVGGTNAGFVNVVTKSGANKRRAEGFFIGRPATLTSRDAFGHSLDNQQYEFGGSLGGPIQKNRAFYYLGAEQDFLRVPYWTQFASQSPGTVVLAPLLAMERQTVSHNDPTAVFARADVMLTVENTLNLQADFNHITADNFSPEVSTRVLSTADHQQSLSGNSEWLRGNLTSLLRTSVVNQALLQWSRDARDFRPNSGATEYFVNGFGVLLGNGAGQDRRTAQRIQFSDDVSLTSNGRIFNLGGFFSHEPVRQSFVPFSTARNDYSSYSEFLGGLTRRTRFSFEVNDPTYDAGVQHSGLYASVKIPLGAALTLSAGLRWEGQWNPSLANAAAPRAASIRNDLRQWQPRLGLAWNPRSSTTVRISAGLYDAATPAGVWQRAFAENRRRSLQVDSYYEPIFLQRGFFLPVGIGNPDLLIAGEVVDVAGDFHNPRSFQVSSTIEQQFGSKITASLGYLRNSTWALPRRLNENLLPPAYDATGMPIFPTARPDPTIGQLLLNESNAHSTYDGMLMTASFQLPRRSSLTANYTLAHTRDDDTTSGPYGRDAALNPFHLGLERADSNLDVRHNFNVSAVINLPVGFKFNPIVIARSGLPYTPIIGFDTQHDGNDLNDRAVINGKVAGRNSRRQPGFFNLDFRFVKDITLRGEGHHLDLFLDVFNVTGASNRNFGPEAISYFGTPSAPIFSAAQPLFAPATTRFGSARQVQFTARIVAF